MAFAGMDKFEEQNPTEAGACMPRFYIWGVIIFLNRVEASTLWGGTTTMDNHVNMVETR